MAIKGRTTLCLTSMREFLSRLITSFKRRSCQHQLTRVTRQAGHFHRKECLDCGHEFFDADGASSPRAKSSPLGKRFAKATAYTYVKERGFH